MASDVRGNPFETNVLVKCEHHGRIVKSFFVHELSPNGTVGHLRQRIAEIGVPWAEPWDLVLRTPHTRGAKRKVDRVLCDEKRFDDYGIRCWDCVHVVPRVSKAVKGSGVRGFGWVHGWWGAKRLDRRSCASFADCATVAPSSAGSLAYASPGALASTASLASTLDTHSIIEPEDNTRLVSM
ncbi:hypothetical protein IW150_005451 [Coemansia sp. RSA 2607]|nr:hypothetical protein IW150_005451 [Coemansia sp. RSA 2607]